MVGLQGSSLTKKTSWFLPYSFYLEQRSKGHTLADIDGGRKYA